MLLLSLSCLGHILLVYRTLAKFCHTTLSSNMSLALPFISQAVQPPPYVWLLPLLSHHHNCLNSNVIMWLQDVIYHLRVLEFQILWVRLVQNIVQGILSILFNAIFQAYTQIPVTRMGFAVADKCHSFITLSTSHIGRKKRQHDTAHSYSYQSYCFQLQEVLASSPWKSLPQSCSQVNVTA